MEWEAPGLVLDGRAYGEGDLIVSVFYRGAWACTAGWRGVGASRGRAATWQAGNLLQLRWVGRLPDQLGSITGENHPGDRRLRHGGGRAARFAACRLCRGGRRAART